MSETFDTQLAKLIAAELFFLLGMHAARDLFEKSYFALGDRGEGGGRSDGSGACVGQLYGGNT
jgi:hypothetical protein